jgi:hypothetical protein
MSRKKDLEDIYKALLHTRGKKVPIEYRGSSVQKKGEMIASFSFFIS